MEVTIEPLGGWIAVALLAVLLASVVGVSLRASAARVPAHRQRVLAILKSIAAVTLLFTLLRPALQYTDQEQTTVQLLVAADVSRSMTTADGPGGQTRWQLLKADREQLNSRWKQLEKKIEVRQFEFDRSARPADEQRTEAEGDQTAIGQTLDDLLREVRQQRTVGILLLTDGAQRAVPPWDLDPLTAARKLADAQAPLYPVGYGATSLSQTTRDLALQDLLIDPVVFEKKQVPLKVQLRAAGANGQKAKVRVLIEDRNGKRPGEPGTLIPAVAALSARPTAEVALRGESQRQTVELSFVPPRSGELKIAVEVETIEGEFLTRNNRVETIITVRQGGLRVAYFDQRRPEQVFLRMVNGSDKIQLDFLEIRGGRFKAQNVINPQAFERGSYDVYLIGDVPAEVFGKPALDALAQRVQEGAGLLMIGGLQNFSGGGYAQTPLADLLPVVLSGPAVPQGTIDTARQIQGDQQMVPTDLGLKRYVMQLASSDKNRQTWQSLAALSGATRLEPKSALVEVWAQTADGAPLLMASEVGRARVAAFGGDTTYQWNLHGKASEHQRFWRQMILWLARKEADSNQPVWVRVEPRNFLPGSRVVAEFGARTETGEPLPGAEFEVQFIKADGTVLPATPRQQGDSFSAELTQTELAGDYWVKVAARKNNTPVGLDAVTRFVVDPRDLELDQPNADYELLRKLAEATGGEVLRSEDLSGFVDRLEKLTLEDLARVRVVPLWDNLWLLLVFVGVMTAEWACRKNWGLA